MHLRREAVHIRKTRGSIPPATVSRAMLEEKADFKSIDLDLRAIRWTREANELPHYPDYRKNKL